MKLVSPLVDEPAHKWVASKWWYYATVAEAYFGLQDYDNALQWLLKGTAAVGGKVYQWELESSARQLAALARIQHVEMTFDDFRKTKAWTVLAQAFGAEAVPRTAFAGKVGLALSGGGFRASLYHIGVLAYLAEVDLLRHVEVLSCVSGGSIVGAYYYLLVRRLLETKTADQITAQDYIDIVEDMRGQFVAGVQRNVRMRVFLDPMKTLNMLWRRDYSRTTRAGEHVRKRAVRPDRRR